MPNFSSTSFSLSSPFGGLKKPVFIPNRGDGLFLEISQSGLSLLQMSVDFLEIKDINAEILGMSRKIVPLILQKGVRDNCLT